MATSIFNLMHGTRIGLALGGGFTRGIAHAGVLRVFEREGVPIHSISGVSSGAIAAAAFASGCSSGEIEEAARAWPLPDLDDLIRGLLKTFRLENMRIPLAIVASDLTAGAPVIFKEKGDVLMPLRASCAYPGIFPPVRYMDHVLVDGMVAMDVPAAPLRRMGATHVISVMLPSPSETFDPQDVQSLVQRSFQHMNARHSSHWRRASDIVLTPEIRDCGWSSFVQAGERAAEAALPRILKWMQAAAA